MEWSLIAVRYQCWAVGDPEAHSAPQPDQLHSPPQICQTNLEGKTFYSKKDKPLCKSHAFSHV